MHNSEWKKTAATARRRMTEAVARKARDAGLAESGVSAAETARLWFIRLCALRFMEVKGYLPPGVEPRPDTCCPGGGGPPGDPPEAGGSCERCRRVAIDRCRRLSAFMPDVFGDATGRDEPLLPDQPCAGLGPGIWGGGGGFAEGAGSVGRLYQQYDAEHRATLVNAYRGVVKKEDVPAATQFFTPDWIIRYMVDNSLGRYWLERNPGSGLKAGLAYLMDDGLRRWDGHVRPEDIRFLDPCAGGGHILAYAFDIFRRIYRERGRAESDVPRLILENNLFGLELDEHAARLARFTLYMKAREADPLFFERAGFPRPKVYAVPDSPAAFKADISEKDEVNELFACFAEDRAQGSLTEIGGGFNLTRLSAALGALEAAGGQKERAEARRGLAVAGAAGLLTRTYDIVATNPPYLSGYKMDAGLKAFVNARYRGCAGDLFSVFIRRNLRFCAPGGYSAYMTPFVWMFLKTYEKLRACILSETRIATLMQLEYSAYKEATVPVCAFVLQNEPPEEECRGAYIRLSAFRGGMEAQREKAAEAAGDPDCGYVYRPRQSDFARIPGMPLAYWVGGGVRGAFARARPLAEFAAPKQGLATSDNGRFVRLWHECDFRDILFGCESREQAARATQKWYPYNKGGAYRKWYGNNDRVVNWQAGGRDLAACPGAVLRNRAYYFRPCVTWSKVSSGSIAFRYKPPGHIFDVAGASIFAEDGLLNALCGFCNSVVAREFARVLSPTLNFEVGHVARFPFIPPGRRLARIDELVAENIAIARDDWDSFETSWDFRRHPFLDFGAASLPEAFVRWRALADGRFAAMKANEEELNRIFIELYGLSGELDPHVEEADVSVHRADAARDARSFVSYAVGCMFGRYSLDRDGLALAGGPPDSAAYRTFAPRPGNIVPVTAAGGFPDDAANLFTAFLRAAFGEATLAENLAFIADALAPAAVGSPMEKIRRYFFNGFFKDHVRTYRRRPIYWQFDAGPGAGFKALAYMHRVDAGLPARLRADYVAPMRETGNPLADYDRALASLAAVPPLLNPDDGVAANIAKFQGVAVPGGGRPVDLLTRFT